MPRVVVEYREGFLDDFGIGRLKNLIRREAIERFSTRTVALKDDDFSFIFHKAGQYDELTHDIIVRLELHFFPERLIVPSDVNAQEVAEAIAVRITNSTVGVSILFCEIGWGAIA